MHNEQFLEIRAGVNVRSLFGLCFLLGVNAELTGLVRTLVDYIHSQTSNLSHGVCFCKLLSIISEAPFLFTYLYCSVDAVSVVKISALVLFQRKVGKKWHSFLVCCKDKCILST